MRSWLSEHDNEFFTKENKAVWLRGPFARSAASAIALSTRRSQTSAGEVVVERRLGFGVKGVWRGARSLEGLRTVLWIFRGGRFSTAFLARSAVHTYVSEARCCCYVFWGYPARNDIRERVVRGCKTQRHGCAAAAEKVGKSFHKQCTIFTLRRPLLWTAYRLLAVEKRVPPASASFSFNWCWCVSVVLPPSVRLRFLVFCFVFCLPRTNNSLRSRINPQI